uniref:Uncharacterized protein n=1 Tax=Nelumbo nucifera TaxID=4432 RepID=A0A822YDB9_NELNU|nr:TPA_asm: hypothetical protein HUJ06_010985 [Nelumbo nucifera]
MGSSSLEEQESDEHQQGGGDWDDDEIKEEDMALRKCKESVFGWVLTDKKLNVEGTIEHAKNMFMMGRDYKVKMLKDGVLWFRFKSAKDKKASEGVGARFVHP